MTVQYPALRRIDQPRCSNSLLPLLFNVPGAAATISGKLELDSSPCIDIYRMNEPGDEMDFSEGEPSRLSRVHESDLSRLPRWKGFPGLDLFDLAGWLIHDWTGT